jgi:hypothetical protein
VLPSPQLAEAVEGTVALSGPGQSYHSLLPSVSRMMTFSMFGSA